MPATATTSFASAVWGIASAQTGLILESVDYNYKPEKKEYKNLSGNTAGVVYYDEKVSISIAGLVPTATPFSITVASSLTLGNALEAFLKGGITGGVTIVDEVTTKVANEDYKKIDIKATFYPNLS